MWHVQTYRIKADELHRRTGVKSLEVYAYRRQLRWIGHVSRMSWDRLPRKFMSAWCGVPRPASAPNFRWGDGAERAIAAVGLGVREWHKAAADREVWHEVVAGYGEDKNKANSEGYWREFKKRKRNQTTTTTRTQRRRARASGGVTMTIVAGPAGCDDNAPMAAHLFLSPGISLANSTSAVQAQYRAQLAIVAQYNAAQTTTPPSAATAAAATSAATAAATRPAEGLRSVYGPAGFSTLAPRAPTV
jgi:hypothetical protein